jgi:Fic family protein
MKGAAAAEALERLDAKQRRIASAGPLAPATSASLREALRVEHTYASNAIEGNTLTLQETRAVLEGVTVAGKPLRDHLEAVDLAEAFDYVAELARGREPVTEAAVRSIHALVRRRSQPDEAGRYRRIQVLISGSRHVPPEPAAVPALMADLMRWLAVPAATSHPVAIVAEFHARLVTIHPFADGNGRTARLASDLLLLRRGYPPARWRPGDRPRYYAALEAACDGRTLEPITVLTAEAVERTCDLYLAAIGQNSTV